MKLPLKTICSCCLMALVGCQTASDRGSVTRPTEEELARAIAVDRSVYEETSRQRASAFRAKTRTYPDEWFDTKRVGAVFEERSLKYSTGPEPVLFPPAPVSEVTIIEFSVLVDESGTPRYPIIERLSSPENRALLEEWIAGIHFSQARVGDMPAVVIATFYVKLKPRT